ncbi:hypothetical protein [Methyloraptor flagellatus]|jgi:chromosomal replication initiation ATPase DnaA|uniref:Chromosomal replication initiator protein DnaA domain-containing protein n=1 Tax=Methyloraptor flagellatus TaxID=3162530 RepID=A0AAU7XE42_9HYPH
MPETPRQIPLDLGHASRRGRDDFVVGASNRAAFDWVLRWPDWPAPVVLIVGPTGAGKSHLVQIFAEASGALVVAAADLDGQGVAAVRSDRPVVVEDLGPGVPERALFHLLNAAREAGVQVLLTARDEPAAWGVALPDLASRLRAATPVHVGEPDDALLEAVLAKLFTDRQTIVDPQVIAYLSLRIERSYAAAAAIVEALDREALALKSPITRAVAAQVLRRSGGREPLLPGIGDEDPSGDDAD